MNILQICAYGAEYPGNFIKALEKLEKLLLQNGHKTIYAFAETARGTEWCNNIEKRTKVYYLPVAKARILPKTYNVCKKIFKENKIDIIHSHFELYDIPITLTAPKKCKIFWHLHDPLKEIYDNSSKLRKIIWKIQYSNYFKNVNILTVSKKHGEFITKFGWNKDNIIYVPNGIDIDRIKSNFKNKKEENFLMFGWEVYRKGVDIAINAFNEISNTQKNINDLKLICVGKNECKSYIEKNSINKSIIYSEPVYDVNDLYNKCKYFLHISRSEGLSYALLEVIYAGLIVICSDIPENNVAKEFENIFFIQRGSHKELIDKVEYLKNSNYSIEESKVNKNRRIIEKKYSLDAWCKTIETIYLKGV